MVKSEPRWENSTGTRSDVAHCGPRALGTGAIELRADRAQLTLCEVTNRDVCA